MAHFAYKARGGGGELLHGLIESVDASGAASALLTRGITPVDITPTRAPATPGAAWHKRLFRERIKPEELMFFSRQMYTLLKAGVPIMRALAGLQESATNKAFATVLGEVRDSLDAGHDLAAALARHPRVFTTFYVNMVRVGEMTGRLEDIFIRMFHHLEFEKSMREQVRSAVRYPSFVLATMAAALVVVNLFVIPAFAKVYKGFNTPLPAMTQLLMGFSDFMVAAWPLLLAGAVGGAFGFRAWRRTPRGKLEWDRLKLKLPVAGKIMLKATLARFARSLALALRSGVPVMQALTSVAKTVDNDFVAGKIEQMREGVARGESVLRTATTTAVFTPVVLQMVAVGEESGALDDLMGEIAEAYQREVEYELKTLSAQVEPILIVGLAVLVLVLALGVFMPIWDLGSAMKPK
jgi:MSHA biogenesis protein MshG